MKARFLPLLLNVLIGGHLVYAQTGNDNITGPAGIFNGEITTAGDYDPYTTNVRRSLIDILIGGSVGTQPLALVRTYNSRNPNTNSYSFGWGGWRHNYEWGVADSPGVSLSQNFQPTSYTVSFPDGRSETFTNTGSTPWSASSKGVVERFVPMNPPTNMKSYLLLNDGSKVEFTATQSSQTVDCGDPPTPPCTYYRYDFVASAIYDAYGLKTTLTYANGALSRVTEPALRYLQFYYTSISGSTTISGATVIDHVTASDGRTVQYGYATNAVAGATHGYTRLSTVTYFGDSTLVANYTYVKPNAGQAADGVPLLQTCIDPIYAGPMWKIAYTYATANNPDGSLPVYGHGLTPKAGQVKSVVLPVVWSDKICLG